MLARAQNWRHVLNLANQFMSARNTDGSFASVTATSFGPG